ncbi:FG-GAP repeat domain-containing protein [Opitutus terrae]|uniref:FG-GAP repeat protein n=1 Tax=Opitutus terrae (strain DSM 11246 / JCM 15787 / PB90-1) TaxID=452637 RepID=B1ZSM6_OPITP|nr:VCBS repeat-containing protein [Opitutus terrae]ACB73883.1 conserved hypothetical protein [Opitutus terrae PB90-1]
MRLPSPALFASVLFGLAIAGFFGVVLTQWRATNRLAATPPPERKISPPPAIAYTPTEIGAPVGTTGRPWVTNLRLVDLDQDGLLDVIYCEGQANTVRWIRQSPRGQFTEKIIGENTPGPASVWASDVNGSGRLDVLVGCMGQIMPNNDRIGSVIVLENLDNQNFRRHVLVEGIARVSDVRGANLAGHTDGRLDLAVGQFGYDQGETRWMENKGDWQFESHVVNSQSGCVHTPVADYDGDGRMDFAALISQEWEEVHLFLNRGEGRFEESIVWGSTNEDYGSSGLEAIDLNQDGKPDLLYTNGDGFDYSVRGPRPWHGLQWLENLGGGRFAFHRVGDMPGAYGPAAADLNGDRHLDLVTVSGFNDWADPDAISLVVWLNDGRMNFTPVVIAKTPNQLITSAAGDLDGNGVPVIVTGGFHAFPPYENMSNITLWRKR